MLRSYDEDFVRTLHQYLAFQLSERERQRLERLNQHQNDELKSLNATLEKRVLARTAELQQTADMLDVAYEELKHSYATGTEVFSLLVNQRLPQDKQTNRQVIDLISVKEIPYGARLLKLAVDFIKLQAGLILERRMSSDEALLFIRKYAGKLYDPDLIDASPVRAPLTLTMRSSTTPWSRL